MSKLKVILLSIGAFFTLISLLVVGFTEQRKLKKGDDGYAGSPDQMAKARQAKAKKAGQKKIEEELQNELEDGNEIELSEDKGE